MRKLVIFLMLCFVIFSVKAANAQTIYFGDNSFYWPDWDNGTGDDSKDTIGVPNFTGGQAVVNSGRLASLTFNRGSGFSSVLSPGDLFIDLGADEEWDYIVDLTDWGVAGPGNSDPGAGYYNLYDFNDDEYILSGQDRTDPWSNYYIRDEHPVAADIPWLSSGGSVYFNGWNGANSSYTFTLPNRGLDLENSDSFIIGWTVNCANDVIYEKLTPIPEPATLTLLGLGLLGLVGLRKKKIIEIQ